MQATLYWPVTIETMHRSCQLFLMLWLQATLFWRSCGPVCLHALSCCWSPSVGPCPLLFAIHSFHNDFQAFPAISGAMFPSGPYYLFCDPIILGLIRMPSRPSASMLAQFPVYKRLSEPGYMHALSNRERNSRVLSGLIIDIKYWFQATPSWS